MFKYKITYEDYNGTKRTEEIYFNLSKAELADLQTEYPGGMDKYVQRLVDDQDVNGMYRFFKKVMLMSYGVKSEDGRRFIKNAELLEDFQQTEGFSEFLYKLCTDEKLMRMFTDNVLPQLPQETTASAA